MSLQMKAQPMPGATRLPAIKISLASDKMAVRAALKKLLDELKPLALDIEEAGTVELVMAEALNNIVEHANTPAQTRDPIFLTCTHARDGLHFSLVDRGRQMPKGQTPLGVAAALDVDMCDIPEGGFGWFLIKDLAKDVRYRRADAENRLSLRLAIAMH